MRCLILLLAWMVASPALASSLADIEVFDRAIGGSLPVYEHRGRLYVIGEPHHQYELRIRNRSGRRVLAVASVDGVNVVTGETASEQQSGYVLDPYGQVHVEGWRKSLDEVATFYFTNLPDSYAARTGRPNDVGVIGVAIFEERERCCRREQRALEDKVAPPSSASPEQDQSSTYGVEPQLGTGHGHRESSHAQYVDFERASKRPSETLVIYYDSRRNLISRGVLPKHSHQHAHGPKPFPNGFVPDP